MKQINKLTILVLILIVCSGLALAITYPGCASNNLKSELCLERDIPATQEPIGEYLQPLNFEGQTYAHIYGSKELGYGGALDVDLQALSLYEEAYGYIEISKVKRNYEIIEEQAKKQEEVVDNFNNLAKLEFKKGYTTWNDPETKTKAYYYYIDVDPEYFTLDVVSGSGTVGSIVKGAGGVAGINAHFFKVDGETAKGDKDVHGLFVENGVIKQEIYDSEKDWPSHLAGNNGNSPSYVFTALTNDKYSISEIENIKDELTNKEIRSAVQSNILVYNHKAIDQSTCELGTGSDYCGSTNKRARSVICQQENGFLKLMVFQDAELYELANFLTTECKHALNLDGGRSSAIYYSVPGQGTRTESVPDEDEQISQRSVKSAIVVKLKAGASFTAKASTDVKCVLNANVYDISKTVSSSYGQSYNDLINKISKDKGINPIIIKAIIDIESDFNPNAISSPNSKGLSSKGIMQIRDSTFDAYKDDGYGNIFNAEDNIKAGVNYYKKQVVSYGGDACLGLAAYNEGPGNVQKGVDWKTRSKTSYVQNAINDFQKHGGVISKTGILPTLPDTSGQLTGNSVGLSYNQINNGCSYCGTNINILNKLDPSNSCASENVGKANKNKICCQGLCPSGTKALNIEYYSQYDSSLNKRVEISSGNIAGIYSPLPGNAESTCWRDSSLQSSVSASQVEKLKTIKEDYFYHARTMASSGCGVTSLYMILKSHGFDIDIYDLFCPDGKYLHYTPGGTGYSSRQEGLAEFSLSDRSIPASEAKEMSFEEYRNLLSNGQAIILNIGKTNKDSVNGIYNQMSIGEASGHNLLIVGTTSYNGINYILLHDPGSSGIKGKNLLVTFDYMKAIMKTGLNVAKSKSGATTSGSLSSPTAGVVYNPGSQSYAFAALPDTELKGKASSTNLASSETLAAVQNIISNPNIPLVFDMGDRISGGYSYLKYPSSLGKEQTKQKIKEVWAQVSTFTATRFINAGKIYLPVIGNHDYYYSAVSSGDPNREIPKEAYIEYWSNHPAKNVIATQTQNPDLSHWPRYYSFDYNGDHFIVLLAYWSNKFAEDTNKGKEQFIWLENDLKNSNARGVRNKFAFAHSNLVPVDRHFNHGYAEFEVNGVTVKELLTNYGVTATYGGHEHVYHKGVYDYDLSDPNNPEIMIIHTGILGENSAGTSRKGYTLTQFSGSEMKIDHLLAPEFTKKVSGAGVIKDANICSEVPKKFTGQICPVI